MRNAFIQELTQLAEVNENIWLLCGDLGFSVLEKFAARFPKRYINAGVAEQNMAGIAAGLALSGATVFVYSIGNFPTLRCVEQIRNSICYHGADVKIVALGSGLAYGSHGYTHHAIEDLAVMSAMPGIEIFTPSDPEETRIVTRSLARNGRPSYLRLGRAGEPTLQGSPVTDVLAPRLLRPGKHAMILTAGAIASTCIEAAHLLQADELDVGVTTILRMKPLDEGHICALARSFSLIFTVEEHILRGGLFASVAAVLAGQPSRAAVIGLGIPDPGAKPSLAGTREELLAEAGLSAGTIAECIRSAVRNAARHSVAASEIGGA